MIVQNKKSKKLKLLLVIWSIFLCCILSFALGVILLKNGTLRKVYDEFEYILSNNDNIELEKNNEIEKIDTLYVKLSKKKFNKVSILRNKVFFNLKNLLNYNFQWTEERPWIKTNLIFENRKLEGKVKLIGLNSDHYREGANWSTRIKTRKDQYIYGFSKFNLLNPYSRGYFIDLYYNELNRTQGGLYIPSKPIITQLGSEKMLQLFEPFFSKELIEFNHHKDFLILNADSTDIKGKTHLRIISPDGNKISPIQKKIYQFYESQYQNNNLQNYVNKDDLVLQYAIGVNVGEDFHHIGFNSYYYADPMIGELRMFMREVNTSSIKLTNAENSIKKLVINRADSTAVKQLINNKLREVNETKFENLLIRSKNFKTLYYYSHKLIPRSSIYANKINSEIVWNKNNRKFKISSQKKNLRLLNSLSLVNKSLIFDDSDSIIINSNSKIILKNSQIIFKGYVRNLGQLLLKLDNNSSVIFERCLVNISNARFTGGGTNLGNKLINRQVSSPFNFAESNIVIKNSKFDSNYAGDDLVNFYRSSVYLKNCKILNARYDGLDFDWCTGKISNCFISSCGNDGLDFAGSEFKINNTTIIYSGDKCVSIGEKSTIDLNQIGILKSQIGIAIKDESTVSIKDIHSNKNAIDLVGYSKKAQYNNSKLVDPKGELQKLSYLIEQDVVIKSSFNKILRTKKISQLMYGNKYGRASVR